MRCFNLRIFNVVDNIANFFGDWLVSRRRGFVFSVAPRTMAKRVATCLLLAVGAAGSLRSEPLNWPDWSLKLAQELEPLANVAAGEPDIWASLPFIHTRDRGISGDGQTDESAKIQATLDELTRGGTLVFDEGTYLQSTCLFIRHDKIRILGIGATLKATNPANLCVWAEADDFELRNLELVAPTAQRGLATRQARIVLRGARARVIDNVLIGSTSAGIWLQGAKDFRIVGNYIARTMADGIHNSEGSSTGYIARNTLDFTGDDAISVVSYRSSSRCGNMLIEKNLITNVPFARGIAVVGSNDVIVKDNRIIGTGRAAGIIVTRESSYNTYGVDRVIISNNYLSKIENYSLFFGLQLNPTRQGAIDVNAHDTQSVDLRVDRVLIVDNQVEDAKFDGIRLLGGICDVSIIGNAIANVGEAPIAVIAPTCGDPIRTCIGNRISHNNRELPEPCRTR